MQPVAGSAGSGPSGHATATVLCQVRSCIGVMLLSMVEGMAIGWASPAIEKMSTPGEAPLHPSHEDIGWIVSLFDIGVLLGSWSSTLVFAVATRRLTIMVGPVVLSLWVALTCIGSSVAMLIAARLLAGCGMGIALSFSFIYVGEVTSATLRGPLILATTLLMPTGQLVAFLLGSNVPWLWQSLYPAPFIVAMALSIIFLMEESPFHYAMRDWPDEVERSLRRLRVGVPEAAVREEAASILRAVKQQREDAQSVLQTFSAPGAKKAAFIVLVESSALAVLGVTCVLAYTQQIFTNTNGSLMSPVWSSVLVMIVEIAMIAAAMYAIERLGRRVQLSLAAFTTSLAMFALAAYCMCSELGGLDVSAWNWVPLASVAVFIGAVGGGMNTVPQVLMSELLSQRAKTIVAPVCMALMAVSSFAINNRFLPVGQTSGFYVPFLFFACSNLAIGLFTLLVVPETKGKTLAEVQDMLRGQRTRKEPL